MAKLSNGVETTGIRIAIVEDSPVQLATLKYFLESNGFDVLSAKDGLEGFNLIMKSLPTIVISDILMPLMDGYELCTKVKSDAATRDIPVILLTQLSDPYDIIRGLQAGADNFIIKPYDQDNLLLRVEHLLENLELRRMGRAETAIEIFFKGGKYQINSERRQILDLLLSVFDEALEKNRELLKSREKLQEINEQLEKGVTEREKLIDELTGALAKVKTLSGLIPICASCKKIRNDKGYWLGVEEFVRENSDATFSHSLCNACLERLYPEDVEENRKKS